MIQLIASILLAVNGQTIEITNDTPFPTVAACQERAITDAPVLGRWLQANGIAPDAFTITFECRPIGQDA